MPKRWLRFRETMYRQEYIQCGYLAQIMSFNKKMERRDRFLSSKLFTQIIISEIEDVWEIK